jgi:hypothetical protein
MTERLCDGGFEHWYLHDAMAWLFELGYIEKGNYVIRVGW